MKYSLPIPSNLTTDEVYAIIKGMTVFYCEFSEQGTQVVVSHDSAERLAGMRELRNALRGASILKEYLHG